MRLTMLGVEGPYPSPGGACSGYLLRGAQGETVLIDCGPGVMARIFQEVPIEALDAVVLSHLHFDHMSDMLALRYAAAFSSRKAPLPVYAPAAPQRVYALLEGGDFSLYPHAPFCVGALCFSFLPAVHSVPGSSVRVQEGSQSLLYTGDTNMHDALPAFAAGCALVVADCALTQAMWSKTSVHLCAPLCGRLALDAGAAQLALSHFRPGVDRNALLREARSYFPDAVLARPGMTLWV